MLTTGGLRPRGMSEFAERVYDVLEVYSVSPWNLLKSACGWYGVDPLTLEAHTFAPLIDRLGAQVARMTDEENAAELVEMLKTLSTMG